MLFNENAIKNYQEEMFIHRTEDPDIISHIGTWKAYFSEGDSSALNEANLEQSFNNDFFVSILGYSLPPGTDFTFLPKKFVPESSGYPDFTIGHFSIASGTSLLDVNNIFAVGELKKPNTDLDKVDPSRGKSPVGQAFEYSDGLGKNVLWVIVSNMKTIRLYSTKGEYSDQDFQEFDITRFVDNDALTDEFWLFFFTMHNQYLNVELENNPVSALLSRSLKDKIDLTEHFYSHYQQIFRDALTEFDSRISADPRYSTSFTKDQIANATQRFLHRAILACFMSDHPFHLLPKDALKTVIDTARSYPVISENKIYPAIRDFFKIINKGKSLLDSSYIVDNIFGYNGGLYAEDEILDKIEITLPDALFLKRYSYPDEDIIYEGILGFYIHDFYKNFSMHLLGRLFEHSISDQKALAYGLSAGVPISTILDIRSEYGVVFTRELLAQYAANTVLREILDEYFLASIQDIEPEANDLKDLSKEQKIQCYNQYIERISHLKILDLAVGSGAFLVECYLILLKEIMNVSEILASSSKGFDRYSTFRSIFNSILNDCLYGKDILGEAISVAKLSLWYISAKKDVKFADLKKNFIVGDSLTPPSRFESKELEEDEGFQQFDLVIGNPPWGAEVDPAAREYVSTLYPDLNTDNLDSYELFLYVALKYVKNNGRICYILPHTLLYPDKTITRRYLLDNCTIEKWDYLGSDWFGVDIRMNTTMLLLKKSQAETGNTFHSMLLADEDRKNAIKGVARLKQLANLMSFPIPQDRCLFSPTAEVELFRYLPDDDVIAKMENNSLQLDRICVEKNYGRGRGIEMNKAGEHYQCPSCYNWNVPTRSERERDDADLEQECSSCGSIYIQRNALDHQYVVSETEPDRPHVIYIDGDSINDRYKALNYKYLLTGFPGIDYKDDAWYRDPKVVIRQAGIGMTVGYDDRGAYCPQSVYIYRITAPYAQNIDNRFLFAVLNSRVFLYYVFKKFAEIDASQAFSKMTHARLRKLIIPVRNWETPEWMEEHDKIVRLVQVMLGGRPNGCSEDYEIERSIAKLYGLSLSDVAYINSQLGLAPYHQAMQRVFPAGPPPRPTRFLKVEIER